MRAEFDKINLLIKYPRGMVAPKTEISLTGLMLQAKVGPDRGLGFLTPGEAEKIYRTAAEINIRTTDRTRSLYYGEGSVLLTLYKGPESTSIYVASDEPCPKDITTFANQLQALAGRALSRR